MARKEEPAVKGPLQAPSVAKLTRVKIRRENIDVFAEDFCALMEAAADDVVNGRMDPKTHSSIQKAYGNMLHMIDIQIRVRTLPLDKKFLKP